MKPYCTPLSRDAVETIAVESVDTLEFCPEIAANNDFAKNQIISAFSDPGLPDVFEDKRHFSNCMFYRNGAPTAAVAERCNLTLPDVLSYRAVICTQIALTFYQSYIQEILNTLLIPYCQTHTPPLKHWGMGSIFYWDNDWGRSFYSFWKKNIEDDDDVFCEQILPYLPEAWRTSFKLRKPARCPHLWHTMTYDDMVSVLCSLEKSIDPAEQPWGIGSLARWKDPKTKDLWGKSFWSFWRRSVETGDESIFRERMLPKFPLAWQKKFDPKKDIHWLDIPPIEIANMINTSHNPFGVKKWGLSSMYRWTFKNSERSCSAFVCYWRRSVEGPGEDTIFRRDILPLLSNTLQKTYRPVGYTMPLRDATGEDRRSVDLVDDPDSLYELADKGSPAAFLKLKRILIFYVTSHLPHLDMQMDSLDHVIERVIHMHLPFFGKITTYALSSTKNFFLFFSNLVPLIFTGDHPHPRRRSSSGLRENIVEISAVSSIDASREVQYLQSELIRQGFPLDLILRLFDILVDGVSLDEIISPVGAVEYEIDSDVVRVASALAAIIANK
jgi:hypothetical protein